MATNPLARAIRSTKQNDKFLLRSFGKRLGTAQHPRGQILSLYRKYRVRLNDLLRAQRPSMEQEFAALMADMRRELEPILRGALIDAREQGQRNAQAQADFYMADGLDFPMAQEMIDIQQAQRAWASTFDTQVFAIQARIRFGVATAETVVGDADRLGLFQPAPMQREGSRWIPEILWVAWTAWIIGVLFPVKSPFDKQVVAAVDSRTTETCLNANGQIVNLDNKFKLSGTPRFARRMDWTPFHWYCRSSVVLYQARYDDGITERQRALSAGERKRREEEEKKKSGQ